MSKLSQWIASLMILVPSTAISQQIDSTKQEVFDTLVAETLKEDTLINNILLKDTLIQDWLENNLDTDTLDVWVYTNDIIKDQIAELKMEDWKASIYLPEGQTITFWKKETTIWTSVYKLFAIEANSDDPKVRTLKLNDLVINKQKDWLDVEISVWIIYKHTTELGLDTFLSVISKLVKWENRIHLKQNKKIDWSEPKHEVFLILQD